MQNLSCENEFYLHDTKRLFPYQQLGTQPHFETEACGKPEMAYLFDIFSHFTGAFYVWVKGIIDLKQQYPRDIPPLFP